LKIADFGQWNQHSSWACHCVLTQWHQAPECILSPSQPNAASDLWSTGTIYMEMLKRERLFPGTSPGQILCCIAHRVGFDIERYVSHLPAQEKNAIEDMVRTLELPEAPTATLRDWIPNAPEAGLDLAKKLLDTVPSVPVSARDALAHPYIRNLRDPAGETTAVMPSPLTSFKHIDLPLRALKDRVYAECARRHPEIIARDLEWLWARGFCS